MRDMKNNSYDIKSKLSDKKTIIPFIFMIAIIVIISFFLSREKDVATDTKNNVPTSFISYDVYGEDVFQLVKQGEFYIVINSEGKILLKTKEEIQSFCIVGEHGIAYICKTEREERNVKFKSFENNENKYIYKGSNLRVASSSNAIYIVDISSKKILMTKNNKLCEVKYNGVFQNIFTSKNKVFITTTSIIQDTVFCSLYEIVNGKCKSVYNTSGIIESLDVDYHNSNKLFLSINTKGYSPDKSGLEIRSILIDDIYYDDSNKNVFTNLKGKILSLKDDLIFIEDRNKKIYSLYSDMTYKKHLGTAHEKMFNSMFKYNGECTTFYYINTNDRLVSYVV